MTTQQPDALQCAAELEYSIAHHGMQDAFTLNAYSAMQMVRTQHARITELESQLAQRFDAADMATAAQAAVQDDLITIRKSTTSAEMLWLLKLAHLVISDVDKTLEETFTPAQPAAEASRFGSPELQARIIARFAEKDQAESVYAFRRKGLEDFCTCDEARYEELSNKPHLFETRVFYTAPQPSGSEVFARTRDFYPDAAPVYTLPPEGMAGWMPIETAPKDGSRILLHPAVEVADDWSKGRWNGEHECWIVGGSPSGVVHTAWHPLPPAPSTEGESNG